MDVVTRCNVTDTGRRDAPAMVFAHGFGCDQTMWRKVAPAFEADHRIVLFDYVGFGGSDLSAYDAGRYATLEGHVGDLLDVCHALDLSDAVFVGHSVSAMVGVLAHLAEPDLFRALVLVGPSARYLDDEGYVGGFSAGDIADLLELMDSNHLGWQDPLAAMVMGNPERPELKAELENSFCRTRPDIARQFAEVTFLGDNRADLPAVKVPTLVLQTAHDSIAPVSAGEFVHAAVPGARLSLVDGHGHCPQLSAPEQTVTAIREFLSA